MKNWIMAIVDIKRNNVAVNLNFIAQKEAITQLQNKYDNLVDRVNQLEQTVQSLSDENQTLIQKLYSKKGE